MATASFCDAPDVKKIAEKLIPKYHGHINDFSVRIDYVFINKIPKRGGKEVWGYVTKFSGLHAHEAKNNTDGDSFFVMVISAPIWDILSDKCKEALVDHELCHVGAKLVEKEEEQAVKLYLIQHDMEEFLAINRRYGNWQDEVKIAEE